MYKLDKNIIKLYNDKFLSVQQIAEKLNYSLSKIRYILNKNNIKRRKIGEAIRCLNITKFKKGVFNIKENLSIDEEKLRIAGTMLYWGEGTKSGNCVTLSNSNPELIAIFLKFLRDICGISENRMRALLHIYSDHDEKKLINFWSQKIKIPKRQFSKTYIHNKKSGNYKKISEYGTISIRYSDKKLLTTINNWIKDISENI